MAVMTSMSGTIGSGSPHLPLARPARLARRGLTLFELLIAGSTLLAGTALLLPSLSRAREAARDTVSLSNLRQLSMASMTYSTEFRDRLPAFNWTDRLGASRYDDLERQRARGGAASRAAQAVDLLRRRAGREDIPPIEGWLPDPLYTPVLLSEYLTARLPENIVVSPRDALLGDWQDDPRGSFDRGGWGDRQPEPTPGAKRWPYSSSYEFVPAGWDAAQTLATRPGFERTPVRQGRRHDVYLVSDSLDLPAPQVSMAMFPASKVQIVESIGTGRSGLFGTGTTRRFFTSPGVRSPQAFFDGHARIIEASGVNPGWDPHKPSGAAPTLFAAGVDPWHFAEDPDLMPETVAGRQRWTRGGLRGIDVDAPEIATGQPGAWDGRTEGWQGVVMEAERRDGTTPVDW